MTTRNGCNKPSTSSSNPRRSRVDTGRHLYTNKHQFKAMIDYIERNTRQFLMMGPLTKDSHELTLRKEKWEELKEILNELGPPMLETIKWKRVWKDWKYNVRSKVKKSQESNTSRLVLSDVEIRAAKLLDILPIEQPTTSRKTIANDVIDDNHKKDDKPNKNDASGFVDKRKSFKVIVEEGANEDDDNSSAYSSLTQSFMPLLMKQMESQSIFLQQITESLKDMKSIYVQQLNLQKKSYKLKKHLIEINED